MIENIGIERSLEKMRSADVVIYIFDTNTETAEGLQKQVAVFEEVPVKYLLVANKADIKTGQSFLEKYPQVNLISAKNNVGIEPLKTALYNTAVQDSSASDNTIVTNARHLEALQEIQRSIAEIRSGLDKKISGDLLALDIRRCLYYLGEITGEVTNEDKLDFIFSKFCIGK